MNNLCALFSTEPLSDAAILFLDLAGNAFGEKTGKELQRLFSLIKPRVSFV
ncbi:MAG: hypothetical protein P4L65_04810 [Legionella sp.]|nr:hypothetical protein [Legionella sp.]